MDRVAAATIVARSHIPFARVLAASFNEHNPGIPFFVLLADGGFPFEPAAEPFKPLSLEELPIPRPERFLFNYTKQELSYACTPYLLDALLERGFSSAAFFKQESLVTGDISPVLAEMQRHAITMAPHLLAPLTGEGAALRELNILQSGIFNVGFLGVSGSSGDCEARRFLSWWQDRVYRHCRHDVPGGMHFEQRWLDLAPVFFRDVHMVRDPGFNLGHWNLPEREVRQSGEGLTAGGNRLRFVRFSGFDPEQPDAVTRYHDRLDMKEIGPAAADLFRKYAKLLTQAGYGEASQWPYAYARFDNGIPIPDVARQLYREMGDKAKAFGDPFAASGPGSLFEWLRQPVETGCAGPLAQRDEAQDEAGAQDEDEAQGEAGAQDEAYLSQIWDGVYKRRPDVQAAFPDHMGAGREAFLDWAMRYGMKEHGIPEAFHPFRAGGRDGA